MKIAPHLAGQKVVNHSLGILVMPEAYAFEGKHAFKIVTFPAEALLPKTAFGQLTPEFSGRAVSVKVDGNDLAVKGVTNVCAPTEMPSMSIPKGSEPLERLLPNLHSGSSQGRKTQTPPSIPF